MHSRCSLPLRWVHVVAGVSFNTATNICVTLFKRLTMGVAPPKIGASKQLDHPCAGQHRPWWLLRGRKHHRHSAPADSACMARWSCLIRCSPMPPTWTFVCAQEVQRLGQRVMEEIWVHLTRILIRVSSLQTRRTTERMNETNPSFACCLVLSRERQDSPVPQSNIFM